MSPNHKDARKVLLVAAVVSILALLTPIGVNAQDTVLTSASLVNEVTVDGSIGADEWRDATKIVMEPFWGYGAEFGNSLLYIKNDAEFLYILFDQADTGGNLLCLVMGIDVDANDNWTVGVDASLFVTYNKTEETPWNLAFRLANETYPLWDPVEDPGIAYKGRFGRSGDIPDIHPILELKVPLELIGVEGSEGGTVGFYFLYLVIKSGETAPAIYLNLWPYWWYWWSEDQPDYPQPVEQTIAMWGSMVISPWEAPPPPPPGGLPVWIWPTVAVVVIIIVIAAVYVLRRR